MPLSAPLEVFKILGNFQKAWLLTVDSNSKEQVVQTHLCTSTLYEACETPAVFDNYMGFILDGYVVSTTTLCYWLSLLRDP